VLAQIQAAFGKECLPLNLPECGRARVVDCFYNRDGHSDSARWTWRTSARRAGVESTPLLSIAI